MLPVLLAFLPPLLIGLCACLLLATWIGTARVLAWAAPGAGMGISAVLFFLWSLAFAPRFAPGLYVGLELLLMAGLAAMLWRRRKQQSQRALLDLRPGSLHVGAREALLGLALAAVLVFFAYRFASYTAANPISVWDAWSIWNSRARFLLLGDAVTWRNVFAPEVYHADYPFLLPGWIARTWVLAGRDSALVPALTAGLYSLSLIGLLGAAVAHFRGLANGLLAALVLASLPEFVWFCANQYADLPLGFYMLAALVLLALALTGAPKIPALAGAGVMVSFAVWTKNEGASFLLAVAAAGASAGALAWLRKRKAVDVEPGPAEPDQPTPAMRSAAARRNPAALRSAAALQRAAGFLAGLAPVLLVYAGFKLWLAPPGDLLAGRSVADLLRQASDPERYALIGAVLWDMLIHWGGWRIPFFPALAAAVLVGGWLVTRDEKRAAALIAGILALTFAQYLAVFLITPHDLNWHLATALGRLVSQLAAPLVLLAFLYFKRL